MSRQLLMTGASELGFPRVSGDEPIPGPRPQYVSEFSPRERG